VRTKVYLQFFHYIVYAANEGCHIRTKYKSQPVTFDHFLFQWHSSMNNYLNVHTKNSDHTVPRLMPTVTNYCDEEEWPQNSSQNLHNTWCTTLSYSHGYFCSFFIELNTLASGTMTSGAQLSKSETEWQSDCESLSTSPLFALFTCCWKINGCHLKLC
jgi:hypothetical protein